MSSNEIAPGQRKVSVEQAFRLANEHHAAGRRAMADALLDQILKAEPRHALAWQLRAILAHEAGRADQAIELMDKAIQCQPAFGQFYANRGEMHRLAGHLDQAVADGQQAVRLDPRVPVPHGNLGIAWYHKGELEKAEECQKQALALDPGYLQALNNLGSICRDRQDREGAVAWYRKALALRPGFVESANNLGAVLTEMEDPEGALKLLLEVVKTRPDYAEAHCNVGNACLALEDYRKAEQAYRNAIRLKPDYSEAMEGLARSLQEMRQLQAAEELALKALALAAKPRAATHTLLGGIYSEQGFPDKAFAAFDAALALNPDFVPALLGKGHLHMELGKMDAAEKAFEDALRLNPAIIGPRLSLTQVRKTRAGDANFLALQEAALTLPTLAPTRAIPLHFALGKAYEDLKQYDEAFPHYLEGCRLKRARTQYDADNQHLIAENICRMFTKERIDALRGGGSASTTPIFVLGMPRSGTTLTETIIASHPDVYGAGELPDLMRLIGQPLGQPPVNYPLNLPHMTVGELTRRGEQYVQQLQQRAPGSPRITDKMPANFMGLGMIHLMLPKAKIVHVRRNPVDTCLSGFTRLFNRSQHHTYDLREMGRYYRDYASIMAHWREVLPADAFYEIQYEDLVSNQEEETRKLIAYCGLEWNEACLDPHKTERSVKTASITQVRQPVYQSSVERWRVYEKFLGPLLEELRDVMPQS